MSNDSMGRYSDPNSHEALLRWLSEGQGGHVTRDQMLAAGLTISAIKHLIKRGLLIRAYRGVYAVGHLPQPPLARAHAALLAVGDRSAIGHASALTFWGHWKRWDSPFEISTPERRAPRGITVHHCATLLARDIHRDPTSSILVTSVARTALDMLPRLTDPRAKRMVNDLRLRHRTPRRDFTDVAHRNPKHPGSSPLITIIRGSQREPTRSELEDAYMAIVASFGLPTPEINVHVNGERVDFLYRDHQLIVEVDGDDAHSDPEQFAADRRRDREIRIATGISTIRFTYDDCLDTPEVVAHTVRAALNRATR